MIPKVVLGKINPGYICFPYTRIIVSNASGSIRIFDKSATKSNFPFNTLIAPVSIFSPLPTCIVPPIYNIGFWHKLTIGTSKKK